MCLGPVSLSGSLGPLILRGIPPQGLFVSAVTKRWQPLWEEHEELGRSNGTPVWQQAAAAGKTAEV